jgi:hypothetical protein
MGNGPLEITNSFDIWSICCLFCDAVAWTLLGPAEIDRFSTARSEEFARNRDYPSDCFHNGREVLTTVRTYLQDYRTQCEEKFDFAGVKVIDLSDDILATTKPSDRPPAQNLCVQVDDLITEARKEKTKQDLTKLRLAHSPPETPNRPASGAGPSVPRSERARHPPPETPRRRVTINDASSADGYRHGRQNSLQIEGNQGTPSPRGSQFNSTVKTPSPTQSTHINHHSETPVTVPPADHLPYFSVIDAERCMREKKALWPWQRKYYKLPDEQDLLLNKLYMKDHVSLLLSNRQDAPCEL